MTQHDSSLRTVQRRSIVAAFITVVLSLGISAAEAATFTVTNRDDSGAGSLRAAIIAANTVPGADTIEFNIPGEGPHRIALASNLPLIDQTLTIDGYSQPGALPNNLEENSNAVIMIELSALPSVGSPGTGIAACASNVSIRGLSITNFLTHGISVGRDLAGTFCGGANMSAVIAGNFIGLRPDGSKATVATKRGVGVLSAVVQVGGAAVAERNVIAAGITSDSAAIRVDQDATGSSIDGNLIGTDPTGVLNRGGSNGISLSIADGTSIGNSSPNLIANVLNCIETNSTTGLGNRLDRNRFVGCARGIDLNGDGVTANDPDDVDTGPNDLQNFPVFSSATRSANGLALQGTLDRPAGATPRAYAITVFASAACASSGHGPGERILGTRGVVLANGSNENFSFTLTGTGPLALGTSISATATDNNDNTSEMSACIAVTEDPAALLVTNINDSGTGSLRAAILQANSNPDGNVIAFNIPGAGPHIIAPASVLPTITESVLIDGYSQPGAVANTLDDVSNAVIKIQINGSDALGNTARGLAGCASDLSIRGLSITNFRGFGINLGADNTGANCPNATTGNVIEGNFLGLRPDGAIQSGFVGNNLGLGKTVVRVGGAQPAQRNVIANGRAAGASAVVLLFQSAGSSIDGNLIGTDPGGLLPRGIGDGVRLNASAGGVRIGLIKPNLIAFGNRGIGFDNGALSGNQVFANAVFGSNLLGIDLANDGVTANDPDDADSGPNGRQNFPELMLAQQIDGGGLRVLGKLDVPVATIAGRYTISLYESVACHSSGFGEGTIYLGSQDVALTQTSAEGFAINLAASPAIGAIITSTATAPDGSTSEFSPCKAVVSSDQLGSDGFEG